jgi:hypothetical protein
MAGSPATAEVPLLGRTPPKQIGLGVFCVACLHLPHDPVEPPGGRPCQRIIHETL